MHSAATAAWSLGSARPACLAALKSWAGLPPVVPPLQVVSETSLEKAMTQTMAMATVMIPTNHKATRQYPSSVAFLTWREAVAHLEQILGGPTEGQARLASAAGILLPSNTPRMVAAARLRSALRSELSLPRTYDVSVAQSEFVAGLARSLRVTVPKCESEDEVRAWVQSLYARMRVRALRRLKIRHGDIVRVGSEVDSIEEVSSIGADGSVFLKGRRRAWPDTLTVLARAGDETRSGREYRRRAANRAAQRARRRIPSEALLSDLAAYAHPDAARREEVEQLERVVDEAADEKPVQAFLQEHPHILTTLMRGPDRFSIPLVRLGRDLVADFFLADVDSAGIRWVLVELETPNSDMILRRSNQLDRFARKGLSQIKDWREWLQDNLDQARRSIHQHGLGLPDIRPQAEGLLLVGRRHRLGTGASGVRRQESEAARVAIHTYDWLLEQLSGAIRFPGPPGANPYLLQGIEADSKPNDSLDWLF